MTDGQNNDPEMVPTAAGPTPSSEGFQFQLDTLMLVTTLIGVILGLGRINYTLGFVAFVYIMVCLVLTSNGVSRRDRAGNNISQSSTIWIFLCSFTYVSTMIILLGSIVGPALALDLIFQIIIGAENTMPLVLGLSLLLAAITFEAAWFFVFSYVQRIWDRATGNEKSGKPSESLDVNQ